MQKIILNGCFGGYDWSDKAILDYLERKGITDIRLVQVEWTQDNQYYIDIPKELFLDENAHTLRKKILVRDDSPWEGHDEWEQFSGHEIDREDPVAIQLLEEKGSEYCSSEWSKLYIEEYDPEDWIADIDEYDGMESLELIANLTRDKVKKCKSIDEVIRLLERLNLLKGE